MLARGRAIEADLGVNEVRGVTGASTACARARGRGSNVGWASVPHASGPLLGGFELGLAEVGRRCRGLAGGGLVGIRFMGRGC